MLRLTATDIISNTSQCMATAPTSQQRAGFFTLPRELRDRVYHHIFLTNRYVYQPFPSEAAVSTTGKDSDFTPNVLQLRYRFPTAIANANPGNRPSEPYHDYDKHPDWLLTCKSFMHEGIAQFVRNAEWYAGGHMLERRALKHWTTRLPIDTGKITRFEIYVSNLAHYEDPYWPYGTDSRRTIRKYAKIMRGMDRVWTTIRFHGHSHHFSAGNVNCSGQAGNMMRNLLKIFEGVNVGRWELGIQDRAPNKYWVLFEWVVPEGKSAEEGWLDLIVKERTKNRLRIVKPEDDLERLLPEGWVCKRPPCECDECKLERAEGWPGEWKGRPDQRPPAPIYQYFEDNDDWGT